MRKAICLVASFAFFKLINNKIHFLFVLAALVVAAGLSSSIPIYLNGSLQNLLMKDLAGFAKDAGSFPGSYLVLLHQDNRKLKEIEDEAESSAQKALKTERLYEERLYIWKELDRFARTKIAKRMQIPLLAGVYNYSIGTKELYLGKAPSATSAEERLQADSFQSDSRYFVEIQSLSRIEDHIALIDGRLPHGEAGEGIYEALVSEGALRELGIVIGQEFFVEMGHEGASSVVMKPVGVFQARDPSDPYWSFFRPEDFNKTFLMNETLLVRDFVDSPRTMISTSVWHHAFDYNALNITNILSAANAHSSIQRDLRKISGDLHILCPFVSVIDSYVSRSRKLTNLIWAINFPVLLVLGLFSVMTSTTIVNKDQKEILLLQNRGFRRAHIVGAYVASYSIMGALAFALGPILGMLFSRLLGASSGFLQFVSRKPLPVSITPETYAYSAAAISLFLLTIFLSALSACRYVVSEEYQKRHKRIRKSWWEKLFFDIVLLAITGYGFYALYEKLKIPRTQISQNLSIAPDPLLFILPTLFILAACLIFLRLLPALLKTALRLGRRWWNPISYASLIQVSRAWRSYHIVNVLIIFVLSVGLFSADAARTLNANGVDRIYYRNGCDLLLELARDSAEENFGAAAEAGGDGITQAVYPSESGYSELPFAKIGRLPGVEQAARVIRKQDVSVTGYGKSFTHVDFIGTDPYDFGRTVWYRNGMLRHHINAYLNLLTMNPETCLISQSLSEEGELEIGDHVWIQWDDMEAVPMVVGGVVDYWPSWDPRRGSREAIDPMLVVANISFIQDTLSLHHHQIWLKLRTGHETGDLYRSLMEEGIALTRFSSARDDAIIFKNDPKQLALNGFLTLAFFILCGICFLCFLIFWYLHLKGRLIHFGLLKAIGLSKSKVLCTVVLELLLVSGAAAAAGFAIGRLASRLCLPLFQLSRDIIGQVPPLQVLTGAREGGIVFLCLATAGIASMAMLRYYLGRFRPFEAIRLGEE